MILLLAASILALAGPGEEPGHSHAPEIGKVAFETTCNPGAVAHFQRGLAWLHSFEYQRSERSFAEAAGADPACAIAYWGVAASYFHPLWAAPTPDEFDKAIAALAKAREIGARSQREKDYIAALGAFFDRSDRLDHKTRVLAYEAALDRLRQLYPSDREAAVFHSLSLIAAGTLDSDPDYGRERKAAALLNDVLKQEPDHPGVTHYLIHGFDYPALADLALPAARRYATIAPDSAHAQHMPSHIFTRLGLWEEAISSNRAAEAAAKDWAKSSAMTGAWDQQLHAMDYLAYAYLQTGRDAEAERVFAELKAIGQGVPVTPTAAYAATAIPARVLLERRQWNEAAASDLLAATAVEAVAKYKWSEANLRFARAVGAARSGNAAAAAEEVASLKKIEASITVRPGEYDWGKQVSIERLIAESWLAAAQGRKEEAVQIMRGAADLDDATEKHPVTPGAVLPAREQLGELLLELGRPAEALVEYEASLKRAPKRLGGLYGAARSAKLSGDLAKASGYFADLRDITKGSDGSRAEVKEARAFAAATAAR